MIKNKVIKLASFFEKKYNLHNKSVNYLVSYANASKNSFINSLDRFINFINHGAGSFTQENIKSWSEKNQSILEYIFNVFNFGGWSCDFYQKNLYTWYKSNSGEMLYCWLTIDAQPPKNLGIEAKKAIFQPDGDIPKMWLWIGTYSNNKLSVELAHEKFIVDAIKTLCSVSDDDDNEILRKITEFVKTNKSTINRLRSQFEFGDPKYLGAGADGMAYAISDSAVLKIFKNHYAYDKAKDAFKRLHENPEIAKTEAMIYDVGELGEYNGEKLYYYIIEKMNPVQSLPNNVRQSLRNIISNFRYDIIDEKSSKWHPIKKLINDPKYHAQIKSEVTKSAIKMASNVKAELSNDVKYIEKELPEIKTTWLESLAEELLMKYLTDRTDLHLGNIGFTKYKEFRYYDPTYEHQDDSDILI